MKLILSSDGASKGNPGEAGIGVVISTEKEVVKEIGEYIGTATNNVAEYTALIRGLKECSALGADELEISVDSELMARQLTGVYKVKAANLIPLANTAKALIRSFKKVSVSHVMREFNKRADELANRGIKEHRKQIKEEPVKTAKSTKEIVEECAAWIKKRVDAAHAKGIILGLSGGIDSAVVAALAKKACGDNVLCVMMPCHSSPSALEDAVLVAEAFDLKTVTVDLTDTYDTMKAAMPELIPYGYANIGPRLRMTTLYAMGSDKGYLVAGTSNRTETMIGYFTKWGDAACDIKPIASFYKYQVYDIARELGVPERLITKPPTADLWEGQTDEGEIGLTYDELDGILEFIDDGEEPAGDPATIEKVKGLIKKSAHKRDAIPVFELK